MSLYSTIRPALFCLNPETAHHLCLKSLQLAAQWSLIQPRSILMSPCQVMGIRFPNPVGLAAGLDKNGAYVDGLACLGFGFLEIGTVTPLPQAGNIRPRLFRLPQAEAIINRMGFNNAGVDAMLANLRRSNYRGVLGINIGKNASTPITEATKDYLSAMHKVYSVADYITVNISSPNTQNLRALQDDELLGQLLTALKHAQSKLADQYGRYVPLAVKIAPDLDSRSLDSIARQLLHHQVDAVIACNTTLQRHGVEHLEHANESGGLSGGPLKSASTAIINALSQRLQGAVAIIGVGGILSGADAQEKIAAGASLVQLYSGLVYRGTHLVGEVCRAINQKV